MKWWHCRSTVRKMSWLQTEGDICPKGTIVVHLCFSDTGPFISEDSAKASMLSSQSCLGLSLGSVTHSLWANQKPTNSLAQPEAYLIMRPSSVRSLPSLRMRLTSVRDTPPLLATATASGQGATSRKPHLCFASSRWKFSTGLPQICQDPPSSNTRQTHRLCVLHAKNEELGAIFLL